MIEGNTFDKDDSEVDSDEYTGEIRQLLSLPNTSIKDVWASNFEQQMKTFMKLTQRFNVIAMDTEFPGQCVNRNEIQRYRTQEENEYILVRSNVEETKLIQIGLTIADEEGNTPYPICTWQFNFKFDINKEKIVHQSADLLKKAGVQFERLKLDGIDYMDFAEYFQASGFVYNKDVKWVVFHGSYDFTYLLKLVSNIPLPESVDEFYKEMKKYFPNIYDLKYIIKDVPSLKDVGLAKLSYDLRCNRIGPQHQAGSDSLLTLCCYFKMLEQSQLFNPIQFSNSLNIIFGIGIGYLKNSMAIYRQQSEQYPMQMYYDDRSYYMNSYPQNYSMYSGNNSQGVLYTYLNQTGSYMMYPTEQHRRY